MVQAHAPGLAPAVVRNVEVLIGETARLNITLQLTPAQYELTVTANSPLSGRERTQKADSISPTYLEHLPINRRNYLDFAQLAPGVVETSTIGDAADYRIPEAPTSGLGFAGSNGRGNIFLLDGIENNGQRGNSGLRFRSPLCRNSKSIAAPTAEEGASYNATINVISGSGTNHLHASAFGYLRNRATQARNFFDPEKSPFTRVQSGISLGGPVRKDRTYFFGAFERLDRREAVFVPILRTRPCWIG